MEYTKKLSALIGVYQRRRRVFPHPVWEEEDL
jgi:hypothetical protein